MHTHRHSFFAALFCAALAVGTTAGQNVGPDVEDRQILALVDQYAASVSRADTDLAAQIWSTEEAISFIHPKGREEGWAQVKANVYENLMGARFTERQLIVHHVAVHVHGEMAWAEFQWDFSAKLRSDGTPVNTRGRETQIYRKTGRGWRIVHAHYSGVPVQPAPQGS